MAKVINRSKETIHFGGHVLGTGEHEIADIDALIKQYPGLSKLVEVVKPVEAPKPVEPEPDATKQPAKEPEEQPKTEARKKTKQPAKEPEEQPKTEARGEVARDHLG